MVEREIQKLGRQISRTKWLLVFFSIFSFLIIGRLFYLQVLKHSYYVKIAATQHWAKDEIQAKRGKIYVKDDMTGGLYPLAQNQTLSLVFAAPVEMKNVEETAQKLADVLKEDKKKLAELFEKNHTYVPVKHAVSHEDVEKIKDLKLPGVYFKDEQVRYYPEKSLASQVLGFVNSEGTGSYGIEQYFDEELSGVPGLYKVEIDPSGQKIAFGNNVQIEPKDGTDIVLTINRDIQNEAERLIKDTVEKFSAEKGSLIVMNPENGEIIAMANFPTYDPNNYKEVKDYSLFKNFSITDVYEPGSIFKVITMAAGLDQKKIEPDTKYEDTGTVLLNGYKIMNSDKKAHGLVTMSYALAQSLNTGTVHVLNLVGKEIFYSYLEKFGFGLQTGIEQPSEGEGVVYTPKEVNEHTYATMSFGQSVSTTPIQMITAFSAVANGGKLVKPHLVAEKINSKGEKEVTDSSPIREVMSAGAAAKEREMMIDVVETGHGKTAKVAGYAIAGKTGTAQVPAANGKGYDPKKNIGSFIGFGPAQSPRFIVLSKVDSPKGVPWAESSAAPIVGKMLDFLFKYYQVPPTEPIK